jgi:light-regulated signal transduction histidine kinase (bacteriophytochrome)
VPGQIQAHGVLLALHPETLRVEQASANAASYLGRTAEALHGSSLTDLFPRDHVNELTRVLARESLVDNPLFLFRAQVCGAGPFDVIGHLRHGILILELEVSSTGERPPDFYELLKRGVARFQATRTVVELAQHVAEEVRRVSGYDRVMVYRFMSDWSGHVIAESMNPAMDLESYLGLHYPASDIPAQARALFLLNTVRMLPDARYAPARIVPELNPRSGKPLDMSHTFLRGASQMYTEYLDNMGVRATLTLALAKGDHLWGMLVCHHYSERRVDYTVRAACELLARVVSAQIVDKETAEEDAYRARIADAHAALVRSLAHHAELASAVFDPDARPGALIENAGFAVVSEGRCRTVGRTPSPAELVALVDWLAENEPSEVFATDALPTRWAAGASLTDTACGLLALQISRASREYMLWMRPELVRTENWAGDPKKPVETGPFGDRLTPRKSFALWQETVRGRSAPFTKLEIDAARRLRTALAETILARGEALARAAHRSRSLLEVADALSSARTEAEVIAVTLDHGLRASGAREAFIARFDGSGKLLSAHALPQRAQGDGPLVDEPELALRAARTNRLVVASTAGARAWDASFGARAALPLGDAAALVGALCLGYEEPRSFADEDQEFLLTLAKLAGQALQRARLSDQALAASEAYRGSLVDSLADHVAVLDPDGIIVEVNEAWRRFTETDGAGHVPWSGVGSNYLASCDAATARDGDTAHRIADGIRSVMRGDAEKFGFEFSTSLDTGRRWFSLRVWRAAGRKPGSVVVSQADVTSIKRAEERLLDALREKETLVREVYAQNQRVEEANRLKSEFLANMSHELRTPLNGIIGFSQLMSDGKAGPISPTHREYLGDVLSSAHHLHELINDVLDLSKIESGKMAFHPENVDLKALLADARDILRVLAEQKSIDVSIDVAPGLEGVELDASRFKQILLNYLSNALKFTPEHGRVEMRIRAEGTEELRLEVEDTGIGIAPPDLPRLFAEFEQLDSSKSKRYQGTGLGLALTKRIVEAQGGRVGVRSEAGKGSVFFAVLPRHSRGERDGKALDR